VLGRGGPAVARTVGIRFVGTGGVYRGFADTLDIFVDLPQLARTPAVVVCSGAKSMLDVSATAELLETLGVPVLGWQTRPCRCSTALRAAVRGARHATPVWWEIRWQKRV
jgi:pseudouridine-5'-phosphate glycosidase